MAEAFPISGNIDPKSFPFLLMDLHHQGATGSLKVEGPAYPKALYYRSGRILFGSSNDPKDQLGSILIENGKITSEQLAEVNTKVGPGNPLAKVLSESGYVNQRELGDAARVKVERILSDILAYTSGTFEFEDGVLPKGAVDLKLSTEKLVVASVRRVADRAFVLRHLDSVGVVLSPRAEAAARLADLQDETGGLSTKIDGRRTLKDAAAAARIDEFEATKIACALLFLGLVDRGGLASAAPEAVEVNPELDLAATAAMAFGGDDATPGPGAAPPDEDPFFVNPEEGGPSELPFPLPEVPAVVATPSEEPADPFASSAGIEVEPQDNVSFTLPGAPAFKMTPAEEGAPVVSEATGFAMGPELETTALPVMEPPREPVPDLQAPTPASAVPAFEVPAFPAQPFEAEPEPAPTRSKPSKEDLAALDALLNPAKAPRKIEAPVMPAPPSPPSRSGRWEPQFQSMAKPRRAAAPRQPSPLLLVAAGVAAIAAIGGGSWYYLNASQPRPVPTPVAPVATPPPVVAEAATPSPVAPPTDGAALPAPDASTGSALGVPSPGPTLAATPSVAPATPPPTPRPASPGTASPLDNGPVTNARSLMRSGSLGPAARGFAQNVNAATGSPYTIQLLVACSTETVQKALDSVADDDLFILPVNYKGKDCHRVCWGLYGSESSADSAAGRLPGYFRQNGASPKVVRTATLLR